MASDIAYGYTAITAPRTIRLAHIHPGNENDPVQISLLITALDSVPNFESVSYCWGNPQDKGQVTCDGTTLAITNSLLTGLVYFRYKDRPRVLWADALCINQADAVEKTGQVLLMPEIYSHATRTLVWLGIADSPLHGTIPPSVAASIRQAVQLLPECEFENPADIAAKAHTLIHDSQRLHTEGKPNILDHDWTPLAALLARPWFRRKWVVQEVSLANQVILYAGSEVEVPWPDLAKLAWRMEMLGVPRLVSLEKRAQEANKSRCKRTRDLATSEDVAPEGMKSWTLLESVIVPLHCVTAISMVQIFRHSATLLDGVRNTTSFNCTDPRDHVYSLLSLGGSGPSILPDYTVPVGEVFRRYAIATLVEGRDLKLLSLAPHRILFSHPAIRRLEGLPSWVPDLRLMAADVLVSYTVRPQAFYSGGQNKPVLSVSDDHRILSCRGRVVDTVRALSNSMIEMRLADEPEILQGVKPEDIIFLEHLKDATPEQRKQRLVRWLQDCYHIAFGHVGEFEAVAVHNPELMMAFSRAMVCEIDFARNRLPTELLAEFPRYFQWAIDYAADKHDENVQHSAIMSNYSATIDDAIMSFTGGLKFCVTDHGRFGQVPVTSQPGDRVCVLVGGEVPFIIRPTGRGTYTLIGECYVTGIMDGEAFEGIDITSEAIETIQLE
ncbi:HET-domain-containing protein [Xylariaceae sp. AK1471]|nr:HET-domain-containing protein [Xylariaceae sp. AK1471]